MILRPGLIFLQARALHFGVSVTPPGGGAIVRLFRRFCSCFFSAAARIASEGPSHFRTLLHSPPQWFPFLWAPISPDSLVIPSLIHQKGPRP